MRIGAKQLKMDKWQFRFIIEKRPIYLPPDLFRPHIMISLTKFKHYPPSGSIPKKCCYKGFIFDWIYSPKLLTNPTTDVEGKK
jgi:hypothetical protein